MPDLFDQVAERDIFDEVADEAIAPVPQQFAGATPGSPFQPLTAPYSEYQLRVPQEFQPTPILTEGPLRTIGRAVGAAGRYGGRVAMGAAQDIGALLQRGPAGIGEPQTLAALAGGIPSGAPEALSAEGTTAAGEPPKPLGERIAVGAVRGVGEMVPALAGAAVTGGATLPAWFAGQMGLSAYGETGDPGLATRQAAVGALMGQFSRYGSAIGEAVGLRAAAKLPAALENATIEAGKFAGQQAALNYLMTAGNLPELMQEPDKAIDRLAEQVGINLAFAAPHLPEQARRAFSRDWAEQMVRSPEYKRTIDEAVRLAGVPTAERLAPQTAAAAKEPIAPPEATKAPRTFPGVSEPLPTPETAPTAPRQAPTGIPEQPVKAAEAVPPEFRPLPQPQSPSAPFSPKQAKAQKAYLLEEIDKAHEAAPEGIVEAPSRPPSYEIEEAKAKRIAENEGVFQRNVEKFGTITIRVPGDGVFSIINERGAIERFKEMAKEFPTTSPKPVQPRGASTKPTTAAKVATAVGKPEVLKAAELFTSQDVTRQPIYQAMWSDGSRTVSTDGRRMIIVEQGLGGTKKTPKVFDLSGREKTQLEGTRFPENWEQVVPTTAPKHEITVDTEQLHNLVRQAELMTTARAKSLRISVNPDNSIGISSGAEGEGFAHNVHENPKQVVFLQPEYLRDALNAARRLGDKKVKLAIIDELSPVQLIGSNHRSIIMPMRGVGEAPIETRQAVPEVPKHIPPKPAPTVPTEAPAISFPGIGSLREKQATAMELGKIRKAEPELWKAITQHFGSTIPARIATLAKERFHQQKAKPSPDEPPLGSATFAGIPDPIATARAVHKLFNEVRAHPTVDRITRQVAGQSAPITSSAAEGSGEALIRFASARGTGRLMGRAKATEVLGDKAKNEAFRKKLGAIIVQDQLLATKKKFQDMADRATEPEQKAEFQDMADKAGAAGSPFKSDTDFQAALADPAIQAALARHREIVQPIAEQAHEMLGGRMMEAGEATGTFANLIAILGEEKAGQVFGGGRGELTRPRKRPSKFFFERKGTAAAYETDYQKIASRMVEGNFDEVAKRELYEQLETDGLAIAAKPGIPAPEIGGKKTVKFEIQRRGTPGGKTQTENLWVREDVARELRQALDVDGPVARAGWVRAASIANAIQLAGPTDAVFHIANMLSSLSRSQGGRNALVDLARKIPGVNVADTLVRVGISAKRVIQDSAEIQNRIAELSDIGAMRPLREFTPPEGLQRLNPFAQKYGSRLIELLDKAGRLAREDLFNNLVRRGLVEDTPLNRREWVNQLGQYNPRLMGQFQRMMRDFGVAPFVVAGRNFNRNAIRSLLLSQGVKAATPRAWAIMKAVDVAGFAMAVFAVPMLLNYWLTGDPKGRPGTKVGEVDTGKGNLKIDPLQWTGLRRGARITGIDALTTGERWNMSNREQKYAAGRDIVNGLLHPWIGPVPKAATIATTGYGSIGYRESANPRDWGQNLLAAAEQLNPVVKSIVKGWEEKAETAEAGALEKTSSALAKTATSLAGSMGLKQRRERTAMQQLRGIHDDWLAAHPSPEVRSDYERNLSKQLPTPKYMAVYNAVRERDEAALKKAMRDLMALGIPLSRIKEQIEPDKQLFHESAKLEREFRASLAAEQRKLYNDALAERQAQWDFFRRYF